MDVVWCQPFLLPSPSIWHFSTKRTDDRAKLGLFLYVHNNNDLFSKCFCSVRRGDRIAFIQLAFSHLICCVFFFFFSCATASSFFSLKLLLFLLPFYTSGHLHIMLVLWWLPHLRCDTTLACFVLKLPFLAFQSLFLNWTCSWPSLLSMGCLANILLPGETHFIPTGNNGV